MCFLIQLSEIEELSFEGSSDTSRRRVILGAHVSLSQHVELTGFEPVTSGLQSPRSPS